ncbi:HD domain-containing phosphohydrolase [Clostridium sp. D53t1_180928_C8]|uniref:HD domain-containing protein n=1 Tax=Clostridium sp. D53t1_180928_C8 TaxID=2787101 RepID=UPI0018A9F83F|nr:HD domain-containing phosphohydrolase [Clostridium sp. D53t1_180928_C8]
MNGCLDITDVLKTVNSAYEKLDKAVSSHSLEVAYLTLEICKILNIDENTKHSLVIAAYFHDFSAVRTNIVDSLDDYESENVIQEHCILGYVLFDFLLPDTNICKFVLYHHNSYNSNNTINNIEKPLECNIIKLADDISIFKIINKEVSINDIIDILGKRSFFYNPEYLSKFLNSNATEILNNLLDGSYKCKFWEEFNLLDSGIVSIEKIIECLAFIIDCKCDIEDFHSLSVSNTSCIMCKYFNLNKTESYNVMVGSLLHDIGKIAIPDAILKKESSLTNEEFEVMKKHVIYTYEILSNLKNDSILNIAANHHEKLNGKGYPRGISNLSLSERIVSVADIFIALIQKRPYKERFKKEKVIEILNRSVKLGEIDNNVVKKVIENYDYLEAMNSMLYNKYREKIILLYNNYNKFIYKN